MDKTRKDGGPAFPVPPDTDCCESILGMSLRMWLAAMAPASVVDRTTGFVELADKVHADAKARFMWADAMLAEAARDTEPATEPDQTNDLPF